MARLHHLETSTVFAVHVKLRPDSANAATFAWISNEVGQVLSEFALLCGGPVSRIVAIASLQAQA